MSASPVKEVTESISDLELVRRIIAGEKSAFEQLMRRNNRRLYRIARSIVQDDAEAEDVLQEAYLQAFRRIDTFRGEAQLLTWLTRIVVNEAIVRKRKVSRRAQVIRLDGDIEPHLEDTETGMGITEDGSPERQAMRAEARQLLERKIDQLPDAFRTVFVLRVVEEMTVEEVSAVLGIPDATVRSRHFRARSMLRESISREFDFVLEDAFSFDGERCDRIVAGTLGRLDP